MAILAPVGVSQQLQGFQPSYFAQTQFYSSRRHKKILDPVATPIFASEAAKSQTLVKTGPKRPFWRDNQKMLKMTNFSSYLRVFKVPQKSFQLLKTCTEHGVGTLKHVTFGFWNVRMVLVWRLPCKRAQR